MSTYHLCLSSSLIKLFQKVEMVTYFLFFSRAKQLMRFAWQIADGMAYLSSRKVKHLH